MFDEKENRLLSVFSKFSSVMHLLLIECRLVNRLDTDRLCQTVSTRQRLTVTLNCNLCSVTQNVRVIPKEKLSKRKLE